jgi:ABC-type bacteriocin/lantibiotic exporter with double-glycine peptidase domain
VDVTKYDKYDGNLGRRLWRIITLRRKQQLILLLLLIFLASVVEVFSIGAILPLMGVLTSPEKVFNHELMMPIAKRLNLAKPEDLLWPITIFFCGITLLSAGIRIASVWMRTRLTFTIGADLSYQIFHRTLHQPYTTHINRNSSEIIDAASEKVGVIIGNVIGPLIIIISNSLMLTVITLALFVYQPAVATLALGGFGLIYCGIYIIMRRRLLMSSKEAAVNSSKRVKILQEGLGGIRDVILDNSQSLFCKEYKLADGNLRRAQASITITGEAPRFAIEALGMSVIGLVAFQLARSPEGFHTALPAVGALAIAAQRLLPILQQLYFASTSLSGSHQALKDTLALLEQPLLPQSPATTSKRISFSHAITCEKIAFSYKNEEPPILSELDLKIYKGSRIGLIGTSGSGKSTLLDILMGLISPTKGTIAVDDVVITAANRTQWQSRIAHVPQSIFLSDASIAENIAFGVQKSDIDMMLVRQAASLAQMAKTIEQWNYGYETLVGERGLRLSGGQRQRIGIARALYKGAEVLILDEATSALDNQTEMDVMKAIENLGRDLTIVIVAHRTSTLDNCDQVLKLDAGRLRQIN